MVQPRIIIKDGVTGEPIERVLNNNELVRQAQERLVHPKDKDHETIPTTSHIQLMLDNIKEKNGKRSDLARELLQVGYKKDVVKKIMDTIDMYQWD